MDQQNDQDGITAYHGSPHDFDKFDISKIGTGEGAQAYGHGLYFAENEGVAKGYRDRLAGHIPGAVQIGDEKHPHWARHDVAKAFAKLGYDPQTSVIAAHLIDEAKGDLNKAGSDVWENPNIPDSVHDALLKAEFAEPAGKMYEVHIKAHPDHFLDWDKPILEQPETVTKLFNGPDFIKNTARQAVHKNNDITYGELHGQLSAKHPRGEQGLTEHLREIGIPGIKYLDAGSRGTPYAVHVSHNGKPYTDPIPMADYEQAKRHAEDYKKKGFDAEINEHGSRNYVVFDHDLVTTKRKYAYGGSVAA